MICLAYLSSATRLMLNDELSELVGHAARKNEAVGVTGVLCHLEGSFLQFLEGEEAQVDGVLQRIEADPRHRNIIRIYRSQVDERAFADWSMALVRPDDVGASHQALVRSLRAVAPAQDAAHAPELNGFLGVFRNWLR